MNATKDAREEATREAAPTATPVVMTIYVPTPEPHVAALGTMEQGIEELYVCLQESEEVRALYLAVIEHSGVSREFADDLTSLLLEDQRLFTQAMLGTAEEDPEFASMLSLRRHGRQALWSHGSGSHL